MRAIIECFRVNQLIQRLVENIIFSESLLDTRTMEEVFSQADGAGIGCANLGFIPNLSLGERVLGQGGSRSPRGLSSTPISEDSSAVNAQYCIQQQG